MTTRSRAKVAKPVIWCLIVRANAPDFQFSRLYPNALDMPAAVAATHLGHSVFPGGNRGTGSASSRGAWSAHQLSCLNHMYVVRLRCLYKHGLTHCDKLS